jgi:hypothetical protein
MPPPAFVTRRLGPGKRRAYWRTRVMVKIVDKVYYGAARTAERTQEAAV